MGLVAELTAEAERSPLYQSPTAVLTLLCQRLKLKACTFYSYAPLSNQLCLRAQVGLSYDLYQTYEINAEDTFQKQSLDGNILLVEDISKVPDYENLDVIRHFNLRAAIRLALWARVHSEEDRSPIGVLFLYPGDWSSELSLDLIRDIREVFSRLYSHSVSEAKLRLRTETTQVALGAPDSSSFLHKLCGVISKGWKYEALSIYLLDERANVLRLRATTGLTITRPRHELIVRLHEDDSLVEAFQTKNVREFSPKNLHELRQKYEETTENPLHSVLLLPIHEPKARGSSGSVTGVIKVCNRLISHNSHDQPVSFGWEDIQLLKFFASIASIMTTMYGRGARSMDDLERGLHGMEANLIAVHANLRLLLEESAVVKEKLEKRLQYALPDCVQQIEALRWQLTRFTSTFDYNSVKTSEVKLYADVLAKLPPIVSSYGMFYNAPRIRFPVLEPFKATPPVCGDADMLLTVFRNLVENSIKYSKRGGILEIGLTWKVENERLVVFVSDNGIGIDGRDSQQIFNEGYKAENAMRRHTVGAGLGLYHCKEIMRELGGDILLMELREPTVFQVAIPIWRQT